MRKYLLLTIIAVLILTIGVQAQKAANSADVYDAEMAKRVGADDYGMKQYVFTILRVGKTKRPSEKEMEPLQAGHLKNIMRLADEGKLVLAGPFMDGQEMRGLFIFNVATVEEAKKLVESDPLISGGYLDAELIF